MIEDRYLGDGVYASFDRYQIWLKADRDGATHRLALDSVTFDALLKYQRDLANITRQAFGDQR